ncbi:restriction endonuclease subunit S [Agrobacterium salinitolerans]|uniref:Restriction endonuclease subunit S n=1 Tax=Agrobacterium salinitolerans TaxID=1183413 RepID=A0A9X3KND2_9HYPH|nr:restriction endonuclease subunit S [Agrobacterium salinitolerans]MCZ7854943.1 restriction endonuclease subunit S [Agrobacterium salinitolerans]MCZ7938024.1 restriction endonuclease subunit S [Agrobacterium salinitolerans]MCZ7973498.1 restriction endonuclease subunit S [Agrobacterium salinitolerans]
MSELPKGWATTALGAVGEVYCGQSSTASDVNGEGRGTPYVTGPEQWTGSEIELNKWTTTPKRTVPEGCIFITVKGAGVGKMFPGIACAIGRDVYAYEPSKQLLYPFVMRALANTVNAVIREARGDIPGLSKEHITDHTVPLPPQAEQKRIVAKLDALNAKSARARTELARIETLVSRYKRAVLSKAFSGELSRSKIRFGQFIETAGNGLSKREGDEGNWINVLRLTDLNQAKFAPEEPRQIRLTSKEVDKYRLTEGDLVVIRVNGSANLVGRSFCFNASDVWAFCDHFIRIRLKSSMDPEFTALFLNSPPIRGIIEHKFVSTSGQKTISQKTLEELPAPLIPLEKQQEIVRRIESAFAKIDRLAKEAKRALELVGRLDEAILAKAFRGELVPQDENDEPAEHLLARIRTEREAAPMRKRGRGAKG